MRSELPVAAEMSPPVCCVAKRPYRPLRGAAALPRLPNLTGMTVPPGLKKEIRADHAGSAAAIAFFRGVLAVSGDVAVHSLTRRHMSTQLHHLSMLETILPQQLRSWSLPLWRFGGWLLGALASLAGARTICATVVSMASAAGDQYGRQAATLTGDPSGAALRQLLLRLEADHDRDRQDARQHARGTTSWPGRCWSALLASGLRFRSAMARRL